MKTRRAVTLVVASLLIGQAAFAGGVGPEVPVASSDGDQRNVVVYCDGLSTLIAFDETPANGGPSKVLVHRYEAFGNLPRDTFTVDASTAQQRRPILASHMVAWVEADPVTGAGSVWWQILGEPMLVSDFAPLGPKERLGEASSGSSIAVVGANGLPAIVWTGPNGRLTGVYRALFIRIGYDRSVFDVTAEAGLNPVNGGTWTSTAPLLVFNGPPPPCGDCPTAGPIKATVVGAMQPQATIEIAPASGSEPRVVFNGIDDVVFWSDWKGTHAQRVRTTWETPVKIGEASKIHDGWLHDATRATNGDYLLVVERNSKFEFLRLDRELKVIRHIAFLARPWSRISIGADEIGPPVLVYAAARADAKAAQAVLRVVDESNTPQKRRSVR